VLIRNLTNYLFQQVLQRNDSFKSAMLVDYEAEVHLGLLHLLQYVFKSRCIDHEERRLQDIGKSELLGLENVGHYILAVYETDHVVNRLPVNGQTRVAMLFESLG
jgi:hypothetical protein